MTQQPRPSHLIKPKTGPDDPELLETLQEGLSQIQPDDVESIAAELVARRQRLHEAVRALGESQALPPEALGELYRAVTCARRHVEELAAALPGDRLRAPARALLTDSGPANVRLAAFVASLPGLDRRLALELGTGLLHLASPRRHWLWTRWLWDVQHQTGILPLIASSARSLRGEDLAGQYQSLSGLIAMATELGQNSGLLRPALLEDPEIGPFAVDAFLAAAYSVYVYGITNWRLSREFNRLLPPLPDLARRLVGLPPARERLAA